MDTNEAIAAKLLEALIEFTDQHPSQAASVPSLAQTCNLAAGDTDAALAWLDSLGAVKALRGGDNPPFHHVAVALLPQGRNLYRELRNKSVTAVAPSPAAFETEHDIIKSVRIDQLRGIYEGALEDLTALTVLVGPNGAGKSTVMEALHIGAASGNQAPFGPVLEERPSIQDHARWLRWRGLEEAIPAVSVTTNAGAEYRWRILLQGSLGGLVRSAAGAGAAADPKELGQVHFIRPPAPNENHSLAKRYSEVTMRNGVFQALEIVRRLLGAYDIRILLEKDQPALFLTFRDYAIPVAAAGAGVEWLISLSLGLAAPSGSLVLVDEPEIHLHPGAIRLAARAIWSAVLLGVQVVLSTHSLELIDALTAESRSDEDLELLSVYRLNLRDGRLVSSRIPGPEVSFLRSVIDEDLR